MHRNKCRISYAPVTAQTKDSFFSLKKGYFTFKPNSHFLNTKFVKGI